MSVTVLSTTPVWLSKAFDDSCTDFLTPDSLDFTGETGEGMGGARDGDGDGDSSRGMAVKYVEQ